MTEDILERAKATATGRCSTVAGYWNLLDGLIAEVEWLRSEIKILRQKKTYAGLLDTTNRQAARIKELEAEHELFVDPGSTLEAAINQLREAMEKIKVLAALNESLMENGNDLRERCQKAEALNERLEAAFLEAKRCPTCDGAGEIRDVVISQALGRVEVTRVCPLCEGRGEENARDALEKIKAEIGSCDHIVEANQLILTTKQREAIEIALEHLVDDPNDGGDFEIPKAIKGLRDLLNGKAGGKDDSN